VGGYRFGLFSIPAGTVPVPADLDRQAALAEMGEKLPGLLVYLEPDNPGMIGRTQPRALVDPI